MLETLLSALVQLLTFAPNFVILYMMRERKLFAVVVFLAILLMIASHARLNLPFINLNRNLYQHWIWGWASFAMGYGLIHAVINCVTIYPIMKLIINVARRVTEMSKKLNAIIASKGE